MRKMAISNIAWPPDAQEESLALCRRLGFTGIEIAPARCFGNWPHVTPRDLAGIRARAADHGLSIVALQGILFGVEEVALFASPQTRARLGDHLRKIAELAGALGARAAVYGAPGSRDPGDLHPQEAMDIATAFLTSVAPAFEAANACLTFEANAAAYGCRFVTHTRDAIDLVRRVGKAGIRLQIDTGTMFLGGEPATVVADAVPLAGHVHVSEAELRPVGFANADHQPIADALKSAGYAGWISVEMRETPDWRANIARAAELMTTVYREAG